MPECMKDYQNNPKWKIFLASLEDSSANRYQKVLQNYMDTMTADQTPPTPQTLEDYMVDFHAEGFMTKSLWSYYAMIAAYFITVLLIDPAKLCPSTRRLFKQWEKKDLTKQSKVFNIEGVMKFLLEAPNDGKVLSHKVVLILALFGLLRKTEMQALEWSHFDFSNSRCILGKTMRKKRKGPMRWHPWIISDPVCIEILHVYVSKFDPLVSK